ncbi:MAG: M23 family metallopeptidase [Candidatus Pacebacteria bacterium]|nr:M23 family metallopeptidase [Candidatus Paceibacterota bacterium]
MDKILGTADAQGDLEDVISNSQTARLLKPVLNSDLSAGKGDGGPTIVSQSALLPVVGPNGSMADIEENTPASDRISIYVVREGDTLTQIAEMFDVSVDTIIWSNNIKRGSMINSGDILVILPVTGVRYTVKSGDTIDSIAKKFKGDKEEIIKFNDIASGGKLAVGDEIIIPDGEAAYSSSVSSGTLQPVRNTAMPSYSGYYMRPVEGGRKSQGLHGYNGIDLATSCGEPIYASAAGDVIVSRSYGWNGGYGNYLVIAHANGTQTLYAHTSTNIVGGGWHVAKGQVIGYVGSTGKSTGCHVHFEVRGAKNPF